MEEKIKVLSLFSSGGVAEAHLEDLGIEILIANEIRKDRCKFYKHLYPKTKQNHTYIQIHTTLCEKSSGKCDLGNRGSYVCVRNV